jgi:hypothetical protein
VDQVEIDKLIGELEVAVDRVRSLYEQYFMGFEKLEPAVPRKEIERKIHLLRKEQLRNTALRFRFQMVLQRYNTYQTHWQRICREIENGTYKRHVAKAKKRFGEGLAPRRSSLPPPTAAARTAADLAAELAELDRDFAPASRQARAMWVDDLEPDSSTDDTAPQRPPPLTRAPPPVPRATKGPPHLAPAPSRGPLAPTAPRPPPAAPLRTAAPPEMPGAGHTHAPPRPAGSVPPRPSPNPKRPPDDLPEERVREIYARYVEAKRRQNESTAAITFDAVAKSLRDSSAKLREKHGKSVDFEVAVRDGKAILKPILK